MHRPSGDRRLQGRQRRQRQQRGFTLIEIMVVIVILGVLAAIAVPRIMSKPDEARVKAAQTEVAQILQALDLYRLDNQRYPTTDQGLVALAQRPTIEPSPPNTTKKSAATPRRSAELSRSTKTIWACCAIRGRSCSTADRTRSPAEANTTTRGGTENAAEDREWAVFMVAHHTGWSRSAASSPAAFELDLT